MDRAHRVFSRSCRVLCAGVLLAFTSTATFANEDNCRRLEALHEQYAGVELTSAQKGIKRQMVAWYNKNCGARRAATAVNTQPRGDAPRWD
jgi:hypothetical protein